MYCEKIGMNSSSHEICEAFSRIPNLLLTINTDGLISCEKNTGFISIKKEQHISYRVSNNNEKTFISRKLMKLRKCL